MKNILLKVTTVFVTIVLFTSCIGNMFNGVSGNKNVVIKDRKINETFTKISVSNGLELYVTQSKTVSLTVEADENLHELIKTEVENGVLKIYTDKNIWKAKAKKIHISIKDFNELIATSGSTIYTENTLKLNSLRVVTTSGANTEITVDTESIATVATSGANLNIMGKTANHTSSATSGSSINAYNLKSKNTTVNVTSGANINIYASENLDAKATSGGDIDFKGNPKKITKKTTSGGSISAK